MMDRRPRVPLAAQRDAAILQLGLNPATAELDHRPPLALRYRDPATGRYEPDANDPRYLRWMEAKTHAEATFKDNGTGRGDISAIAHRRRVSRKQGEHEERMAAKLTGAEPSRTRPKQKIRSRGFDQGHRPLQSRNTLQRRRT